MKAKVLPEFLKLNSLLPIEGELIAETDCTDYDHYKSLPDAIEVDGKVLGKTGWNSDLGKACYKTGTLLAKVYPII